MRLGQLSRKLDLKPTEIRELIRKEFNVEIDLDLNTRIEDVHADVLSARYKPVSVEKSTAVKTAEEKPEISAEIHAQKADEQEPVQESVTIAAEEPVHQTAPIHTPIEIPHYHEASHESADVKDEAAAFIPLPVDPNAELIKVPKIKLEGLKVVGKIDLPQPKEAAPKLAEEVSEETSGSENNGQSETPKSFKERRLKNPPVLNNDDEEYSIFKDKKGIYHFSQTQRENRKNSLERIKLEKLEELRKQKKIKHYQQLVESEKKTEPAAKKSKKQLQKETRKQPAKPVRKGIWGKFLNWLNG